MYNVLRNYSKLTEYELKEVQKDGFIDGDHAELMASFETLEEANKYFSECEEDISFNKVSGVYTLIGYELHEVDEDGDFIELIDNKAKYSL